MTRTDSSVSGSVAVPTAPLAQAGTRSLCDSGTVLAVYQRDFSCSSSLPLAAGLEGRRHRSRCSLALLCAGDDWRMHGHGTLTHERLTTGSVQCLLDYPVVRDGKTLRMESGPGKLQDSVELISFDTEKNKLVARSNPLRRMLADWPQ